MNYPNLSINHQNGSKNYILPNTVKPSLWIQLWAWLSRSVPEQRVYYNLYFKAIFPSHIEVKKGNVYLDKASGVKLVILRISVLGKPKRKSVQFCTLLPLKEKDKNRIDLPLYLKYMGNAN